MATDLQTRFPINVSVLVADLAAPVGLAEAMQKISSDPSIALLVNNAGTSSVQPVAETSVETIMSLVALNVIALTALTQSVLPRFIERNSGTIINIGSVVGFNGYPWVPVYGATQAYVLNFTQGLKQQLADTAIRLQYVAPLARRHFRPHYGTNRSLLAVEKPGVDSARLVPFLYGQQVEPNASNQERGWVLSPGHSCAKTRHDIATISSHLLLDKSWSGQHGLAVLGTEDLSCNDIAVILTDVLGREIRFQRVTGEAHKTQLVQHGANATFANGLAEMFVAKADGLDDVELRRPENTTSTNFRQWREETFRPAFESLHGLVNRFATAKELLISAEPACC